jgi:hypothetical protein
MIKNNLSIVVYFWMILYDGLKTNWRTITIKILDIIHRPVARNPKLALSTGLNWVGSAWRRGENPVPETSPFLWMKDRTMDSIQNCDTYINIPLSLTYGWKEIVVA